MTNTIPVVAVWHTDTGIALTITRPDAGPDDTATTAVLPPECAAALIDQIVVALQRLGAWQRRIAEIESAITDGSTDAPD